MFGKSMLAGWSDLDANAHMKNTAYLAKSADVRMIFFAEHGFPVSEFARLKIGPVILKDEIHYFREIKLLQEFQIDFAVDGLSADGGRFSLTNTFTLEDGRVAARVTSLGGWLDLAKRKLIAPPDALFQVLANAPRTESFRELNVAQAVNGPR